MLPEGKKFFVTRNDNVSGFGQRGIIVWNEEIQLNTHSAHLDLHLTSPSWNKIDTSSLLLRWKSKKEGKWEDFKYDGANWHNTMGYMNIYMIDAIQGMKSIINELLDPFENINDFPIEAVQSSITTFCDTVDKVFRQKPWIQD